MDPHSTQKFMLFPRFYTWERCGELKEDRETTKAEYFRDAKCEKCLCKGEDPSLMIEECNTIAPYGRPARVGKQSKNRKI